MPEHNIVGAEWAYVGTMGGREVIVRMDTGDTASHVRRDFRRAVEGKGPDLFKCPRPVFVEGWDPRTAERIRWVDRSPVIYFDMELARMENRRRNP